MIREAVDRLERCATFPHSEPILADYIDRFFELYTDRMLEQDAHKIEKLSLKLLVDLLFYSGRAGVKHLWLSLLPPWSV